ncbi:MAG: S1 RNA-binding domain-containing protein, partial [Methylocystis sp.]
RPAFKTASFAEGVEKISDLQPGMVLEGVVTNVAAFGAFVDIGVHQDGLVHISAMSKRFVKDPRSVAKPGDVVRVKVLEVDAPRKRISLSMRLDDEAAPRPQHEQKSVSPQRRDGPPRAAQPAGGALGDALMRAMRESQGKGR